MVGAGFGGVDVALEVGVELGGVGISSVGDAVALPGAGEVDAPGLAVGVVGKAVRLGAGDGLALPTGGVTTVGADVAVRVSDGSGPGGV